MVETVLHTSFAQTLADVARDASHCNEMIAFISTTKSPIILDIDGKECKVTVKELKKQLGLLLSSSSKLSNLFRIANTRNIKLRYAPSFCTKETIEFLNDAKDVFGEFQGKNVIDSLQMLHKNSLICKSSLSILWNAYVDRTGIYKNASQNQTRRDAGKKDSRQYAAPDARMKKFLRGALQLLVDSFKSKKHDPDAVNFSGKTHTVETLESFKFFYFSRAQAGMLLGKNELTKEQMELIAKPDNKKVFKEYEKLVYSRKVEYQLKGESAPVDMFVEIAAEVLGMEFKVEKSSDKTYKLGPYTVEQIKSFEVNEGDSFSLAVRALIDTETKYLEDYKDHLSSERK